MICIGCGREFLFGRAGQKRCHEDCGRSVGRKRSSGGHPARSKLLDAREFIGIDGEGVTSAAGHHRYVLLTVGDQSLHNHGRKLRLFEIFDFLYAQFRAHPDAAFVGFYLAYDFAQWLRDLPAERAAMLLSDEGMAKRRRRGAPTHLPPFPVRYKTWEFDMLPMRRFKLRPAKPKGAPWLVICDAGGFFQSSFLKAIDPSKSRNPVVTLEEYAVIAAGKDGRQSHQFGPEMIHYNVLECQVLARLMAQLRDGLHAEAIRLNRTQWIGPGQAAGQWFRKIKLPTGDEIRKTTCPIAREAARQSYFGGWFEIFWHGPVPGETFSYDINSAYPFIMSRLPCLLHGRWIEGDDAPYVLVKARLYGSHPTMGAALHRTARGLVLRPRQTAGWYWRHEIEAAQAAAFIGRVDILEARGYLPCDCAPPIAAITELYRGRLRLGKNTPAGKARKLIYNSGYGKLAQSVGSATFGSAIYASLITAGCRTMITEAIRSHPTGARDLLMVATDSVTFRRPHPGLELDAEKLGAWTETRHSNLSLFMPGVYWDDTTRDRLRAGDDPILKSRGISGRDLAQRIDTLDRAWDRFERDGWPRLVLPVTFQLVSPRQALARGRWELAGTLDRNGKRVIDSDPKRKRFAMRPGRSHPYNKVSPQDSTPYDRRFGEEFELTAELEFGDHPDQPIDSMLPALFGA
jgi:DNA polymerase type B, organellar and viral